MFVILISISHPFEGFRRLKSKGQGNPGQKKSGALKRHNILKYELTYYRFKE